MNAHGMNAGACLGHSASAAQQLRRGRTKGTEGRGGAWSHPVVPPAVEGRVQSARWTGPPAAPFPLSPSPVSARAKGPVPFLQDTATGGPPRMLAAHPRKSLDLVLPAGIHRDKRLCVAGRPGPLSLQSRCYLHVWTTVPRAPR